MATESTASSSVHTNMTLRPRLSHCQCHDAASLPPSPRSGALPSPPDSPSTDSISSFPSLSSSFFFSSGAGSPHVSSHDSQPQSESGHAIGSNAGLIIPSLSLPAALPHPTPYGQTLGELNLLLVGPSGSGKTALAEYLMQGDDVIDIGDWETVNGGRVLRASTDWSEETDMHGLEKFEGSKNVTIFELDSFSTSVDPQEVCKSITRHIHENFCEVTSQINSSPSSPLLHSLLASPNSTLFTALIYISASPLTLLDNTVINELSSLIPVIIFSTTSHFTSLPLASFVRSQDRLSSFQPRSSSALHFGLFRSPQTLSAIRSEAADRFMRWREVETALEVIDEAQRNTKREFDWDKAEWEVSLSEDIARRRLSSYSFPTQNKSPSIPGQACFTPILDPLHFRSVAVLCSSLFFRSRKLRTSCPPLSENLPTRNSKWNVWRWGLTLVGVFCAGVSIGLALSS